MKRIEEMNAAELAALDDAGADALVKLECAHEGVRIPAPPLPALELPVSKTDHYYELSGLGLKSRSESVLQAVLDVVHAVQRDLVEVDYEYKFGYNNDYIKGANESSFRIERKTCFKMSEVFEKADAFIKAKESRERYSKEKDAYDKELKAYADFRGNVIDAIYTARHERRKVEAFKEAFQGYVKIADGQGELALKFFKAAYPELDGDALTEITGYPYGVFVRDALDKPEARA